MDRLTYTLQDDGYLTLWPPQRLGNDFNRALRKVRGTIAPRAATGYALARLGKSEHLPPGISLQDARTFATQWTGREPVTICEAVAVGLNDTVLFRKVERLQSCKRFDEMPGDAELVIPGGEIMMKRAADPKMPRGFDQLADKLTRGLASVDREWFKPYLRKYLNVIAVDWKRLSQARHREIWNKAERVIQKADVRRLTQPWVQRITLDMKVVAKGTKRHLRERYLPRINTALTQPDTKAIGQIGKQQGWFLRDQMGRRSEALTKHGERIVKQGLKDGWGREQIAKELERTVGGMWQKYGRNYSMAVSSVALSRARSWSEVKSYQSIGIEQLEIQAILDEVTTEQCFLAGTKIYTPTGEKNIEDIRCGDVVTTGTGGNHRVLGTINSTVYKYLSLTFSSGRRIMVTENHPVLTANGWLKCGELEIGDSVVKKKRSQKLGNANLQAMQKRFRDDAHLRGKRADEILFPGMLTDSQEEGLHEGGSNKDVHFMRKEIHSQSWVGGDRKEPNALFQGMPETPGDTNMSSLRSGLHGEGIGGQTVKEPLLFDGVQGAITIDDELREDGVRSFDRNWMEVGAGSSDCEILNRLCGSVKEHSNRSGRGILARQGLGGGRIKAGVKGEKGTTDCRHGIDPSESTGCGPKKSPFEIDADTLRVADYLRDSCESDTVVEIHRMGSTGTTVYNLEVETDHTYIAEGIIFHNCRFLDGQVISVNESADLAERGANVTNPEDIKTVNPFINVRRDKETNERSLYTATGTKLASITRSGVGVRDDRGEFRANIFGKQLPGAANIGLPPYHHLCRTYTLPKTTLVQIPRGYQGQAVPIPPRPVPIKPRRVKPKPTGLVPPRKVQPRPALITGDRPVSIVKTPQSGKPTDVGFALPEQPRDPYNNPGLINNISLEKQVLERSKRAMKKLSDSIAKQQKKVGRPLTRNEIGDNLVKEIRREVGPSQSIAGLVPPKTQHKRAYKSKRKLTEVYTEATRFTSERLMKELKRKGMASIVPIKGTAYYLIEPKRISFNPKRNKSLRHEYGHHITTLGKNLQAEIIFRKRHTTASFTTKIPGGGTGKIGNWGDQYCGRRYPGDIATEVFSQVSGLITIDKRWHASLANMWEANPEHIGFALSVLQGSFV